MLTIIQQIILGLIQGITEWIPISSSAALVFTLSSVFNLTDPGYIIRAALFFHLGTFFAALIYFRKEVASLFVTLFNYKRSNQRIYYASRLADYCYSTCITIYYYVWYGVISTYSGLYPRFKATKSRCDWYLCSNNCVTHNSLPNRHGFQITP